VKQIVGPRALEKQFWTAGGKFLKWVFWKMSLPKTRL